MYAEQLHLIYHGGVAPLLPLLPALCLDWSFPSLGSRFHPYQHTVTSENEGTAVRKHNGYLNKAKPCTRKNEEPSPTNSIVSVPYTYMIKPSTEGEPPQVGLDGETITGKTIAARALAQSGGQEPTGPVTLSRGDGA